jgi:hypothetical protein
LLSSVPSSARSDITNGEAPFVVLVSANRLPIAYPFSKRSASNPKQKLAGDETTIGPIFASVRAEPSEMVVDGEQVVLSGGGDVKGNGLALHAPKNIKATNRMTTSAAERSSGNAGRKAARWTTGAIE